jgi:putative tricarboxylic transport membrane protein
MMVVLGIAMFAMIKVGLSAAPLILGLILGSYAEEGLLLTIRSGEAAGSIGSLLFLRPISMVLIALCLISIGSTIWFQTRKKKNTEEEVCIVEEVSSDLKSIHKLPVDRLVTIGFVVLSAILLFMTKDFPAEVALFPRVIIIGIIILSIINLFMPKKNEVSGCYYLDAKLIKWFGLILVTTLVYLFAIPVVGFYTVTFLYMLLLPGVFRSKLVSFKHMKLKDLLIALFFCAILYGIFTIFLSVPTPTGLLI